MAVILVAKINGVFADVRNLLVLAELCKHDQWEYMPVLGNLWKAILPIRGKRRAHFKPESVVRACLYFGFLEECILFGF